jgi:hypothetical protein
MEYPRAKASCSHLNRAYVSSHGMQCTKILVHMGLGDFGQTPMPPPPPSRRRRGAPPRKAVGRSRTSGGWGGRMSAGTPL